MAWADVDVKLEIPSHEEAVQTLSCEIVSTFWIFDVSTSWSGLGIRNSKKMSLVVIPEVSLVHFDRVLFMLLVGICTSLLAGTFVAWVLLDSARIVLGFFKHVFSKNPKLLALRLVFAPSTGSCSCLVWPYLGRLQHTSIFETYLPLWCLQQCHQ